MATEKAEVAARLKLEARKGDESRIADCRLRVAELGLRNGKSRLRIGEEDFFKNLLY